MIEEGDYIRFGYGEIGIVKYCDGINIGIITQYGETEISSGVDKIAKKPIDLIEVGDIVKVYVFSDKYDEDSEDVETTWKIENKYEIPETKEFIKENYGELLSILTHEQYEQNCYKLKE